MEEELNKYIKDKHTQEECIGFIDGYEIKEGKILIQKRYWWELYKKGWHKHSTMYEKVWIKYNWDVTDIDVGKTPTVLDKMREYLNTATKEDLREDLEDIGYSNKESFREAFIQGYKERAFISETPFDDVSISSANELFEEWYNEVKEKEV